MPRGEFDLSGPLVPEMVERFMANVMPEPNSGCWLWAAGVNGSGYGRFYPLPEIGVRAHRFSYRAFRGPLRQQDLVCHKCDVRLCVNPDHFFLGDHAANLADMRAKGRHYQKIGPAERSAIRLRLDAGETWHSIAAFYGVSTSTISRNINPKG